MDQTNNTKWALGQAQIMKLRHQDSLKKEEISLQASPKIIQLNTNNINQ